ncbi:MAG: putative ABC transport system permease protein [Desulforhopalus sp.]|jgi:putative ABC transport system permease protein
MNTLNQKLCRDIWHSRYLILAVSAIIAVGIGCFVGMLSAAKNLEFARSNYYSSSRLADFWIDLKKAPVEEVRRLSRLSGVSETRERIQFQVVLDLPDAEKPVSALLLSMPDRHAPTINNIIVRKGTYFTNNRSNEVIVSEKFANARKIEPGDTITAVLNNQKKDLIVTGIAISAEFVYMASPGSMIDEPGSYGLLFIKRSFAEDIFGFNGACNSVVGLLAPELREHPKEIVEELSDRLAPYGVFIGLPRSEQFSPMVLDGEMKQLVNLAYIFPMFFLVVAALILNILMTRLAEQQRTVIGTLKAIGYGNTELMLHFMKFAVTTGLIGGGLGCLLGYWLGDLTTRMYVDYFTFPELTSKFYPGLLCSAIFIAVLFSLLGTINGVRRIMQLEPAEAMRPAVPPSGCSIALETIRCFWKGLDAGWQMILRGLFRSKGRTIIAIISAAMGSSIVVLAFGFVDSMDEMVSLQFDRVLRSDYHLSFSRELSLSAMDEIHRLPGVIHAEPVLNVPCTFKVRNHSKRGGIMGIIGNGKLTSPLNGDEEPLALPPAGLLMTSRLMEQLEVKAGDYIGVIPVKGEQKIVKMPVIEGIDSMIGLAVYADFHWLNRIFGQQNVINEVRVLATHDRDGEKQFLKKIKEMPNLETLTDLGEQKNALNKQLNGAMRASAVIMIVFAAVIFLGAILNGTLISLSERKREMATFRTMGYFDKEVGRLFFRENLLTNLIGSVLGLPLGYLMLVASMKGFVSDAYSFPAEVAPLSYVYTMSLAVIFVLLSQIVVMKNIQKQNWVEALSLKE